MSHQAHPIIAPFLPMEGESRIRTKSVRLTKPAGFKGTENPEIALWAGTMRLFISADLRDFGLDDLQIRVRGTRLIFHGTLRSALPPEKVNKHRTNMASGGFSHALDLPYEVNVDEAEIQNDNGLVSIVLKRKESNRQNARFAQSSFSNSMKRFFGESGGASNALKDEIAILQTLDRYLEYHFGKGYAR